MSDLISPIEEMTHHIAASRTGTKLASAFAMSKSFIETMSAWRSTSSANADAVSYSVLFALGLGEQSLCYFLPFHNSNKVLIFSSRCFNLKRVSLRKLINIAASIPKAEMMGQSSTSWLTCRPCDQSSHQSHQAYI